MKNLKNIQEKLKQNFFCYGDDDRLKYNSIEELNMCLKDNNKTSQDLQ